jgi:formylmethanofuran dehydrogenase subunit E
MNNRQLANARNFHGHLGPWLVIGMRAGSYARRRFKCSPFELTATVLCPAKPPVRCIIDGIQLSSGCTMGKGNIHHKITNRSCQVQFTHRRHQLKLTVRPEVFQLLQQVPSDRTAIAAFRVARLPFQQLFLVKPQPKNAV